MRKAITGFINELFGPQDWELRLEDTKDRRILRLMKVVRIVRFFVFPITVLIVVTGLILDLLTTILNFTSSIAFTVFEYLNDSLWIDLSWFGITDLELKREEIKIKATNEGVTELEVISKIREDIESE